MSQQWCGYSCIRYVLQQRYDYTSGVHEKGTIYFSKLKQRLNYNKQVRFVFRRQNPKGYDYSASAAGILRLVHGAKRGNELQRPLTPTVCFYIWSIYVFCRITDRALLYPFLAQVCALTRWHIFLRVWCMVRNTVTDWNDRSPQSFVSTFGATCVWMENIPLPCSRPSLLEMINSVRYYLI